MTTPKVGQLTKFHGAVPQVDDPQLQRYVNAMAKRRADNRRKKRQGKLFRDPPKEFVPAPEPPDDRPPMAVMTRELAAQVVDPAVLEQQRIVAERMAKRAALSKKGFANVQYRGRKR